MRQHHYLGYEQPNTMFRATFAPNPRTHAWHIFYSSVGRTVVTAPVEPRSGVPKAPPVKVLDNLSTGGPAFLDFDVANNGMIAWLTAPHSLPIWRLRWFDRGRAVLGTVGDPGYYISLALSPDESRVVVRQGYPLEEFWVYSVDRGTGARLATGFVSNAVWSPTAGPSITLTGAPMVSLWSAIR